LVHIEALATADPATAAHIAAIYVQIQGLDAATSASNTMIAITADELF
jgi:hypothetical protein